MKRKFVLGCLVIPAVALASIFTILVVVAIATSGSSPSKPAAHNSQPQAKATPTVAPRAKLVSTPRPTATPKSAPKPVAPNSVTFSVWGNDGGAGTDVTYSSDSANDDSQANIEGGSEGSPAATFNLPYNSNAEYYAIDAQMQGTGTIGCEVTIVAGGHKYTKVGSASGSYEICSAQLNSGFLGGWS